MNVQRLGALLWGIASLGALWLADLGAAPREPASRGSVAAWVNGQPIPTRQLAWELARILRRRPVTEQGEQALRAATLQQLVDRQLILSWLAQHGQAASEQDVQFALQRLRERLDRHAVSLESYLQQRGIDRRDLRSLLRWELSWQRFLKRYLTDENLERYFRAHQADFDGTRIRAAHILFASGDRPEASGRPELMRRARQVRQQILEGELSFAEAAQQYSSAPTASQGGDIGLISRHEPMPESFSQAAFALEPGELSQPVVTHFGVHLIRCLEKHPGQKRWRDVRSQLERAVTRYLFRWAADRGRPGAEIEWVED